MNRSLSRRLMLLMVHRWTGHFVKFVKLDNTVQDVASQPLRSSASPSGALVATRGLPKHARVVIRVPAQTLRSMLGTPTTAATVVRPRLVLQTVRGGEPAISPR